MPAAPVPADEARRLAALQLQGVLDTPRDPSFDRLAQLAADHFEVPISLVSLVDSRRQWFKAAVGLTVTETPREDAFCAHAILEPDQVLVVENAEQDARFADNPLVTAGPAIRFYAGAPIRAGDGQPLGTLCIIDSKPRQLDDADRRFLANLAASASSMLELHRQNLILSTESGCDPLTGLANRRTFDAMLAAAFATLADSGTFALIAMDLDHFKKVNDDLGHAVGDHVLQEVAARLARVIRGKDLVARLGGDEFAIVAAGPIDLAGATVMARRVMDALKPDIVSGSLSIPIRTSIGIAVAPAHGRCPESLARAADLAMYAGKRGGRHAITIAEPGSGANGHDTPPVAEALLAAVLSGALTLRWQPLADPGSGYVLGYEALPDWVRPGRDPLSAADIVAIAETAGFIDRLDSFVLRTACAESASWPRPLGVWTALSPRWFTDGDPVEAVTAALDASGLRPQRLTIQLSAESLERHPDRAGARIAALRAQGVSAALDDFGTGSASLDHLCRFRLDAIKLDRSFVAGIGQDHSAEAVIEAVLGLARSLGLSVCAKGVGTAAELRFLQAAGCGFVQGPAVTRRERGWTETSEDTLALATR